MMKIVDRQTWLAARAELIADEKRLTRLKDEIAAKRRMLPVVEVDRSYVFERLNGQPTLLDLFEGRRQLIIQHFMFAPEWDEGCKSCSFFADNINGWLEHLWARGTSFAAVSRAPVEKIEAFRARQGWRFPWVSSAGTSFNYDFAVTMDEAAGSTTYNYVPVADLKATGKIFMDELPGISVFLRDGSRVFHSYSTYSRGLDILLNTYNFLDLTPLGRQEEGLPWPMAWIDYRSAYASDPTSQAACCATST